MPLRKPIQPTPRQPLNHRPPCPPPPAPQPTQGLSNSPQLEAPIGSWPSANAAALDAELPDFRGKPVRTGSNLASMAQGMSRTGSFSSGVAVGGGPSAAAVAVAAMAAGGGFLSREGSFSAESLFNACNSAPITPRSPMTPLFDLGGGGGGGGAGAQLDAVSSGFGGKDGPGSGLGQRGGYGGLQPEPRHHKPSKLRISSSEYDVAGGGDYGAGPAGQHAMAAAVQQAAAAAVAASGFDGYHQQHQHPRGVDASTPTLGSGSGSPEPGSLPAAVAHEARLQMHQAALHHQAAMQQAAMQSGGLGGPPGAPGSMGFSPSQPFVPSQPPGAPHQAGSMMQQQAAAMAAAAAGMGGGQMPPHGGMGGQMPPAQQMQHMQQMQAQAAFMMSMTQYAQAAGGQGQPHGHMMPPPFPMAPGAFPGWQPGMQGYGAPPPGGPDGAGMPFGAVPGFGFPPQNPEYYAIWQNIWQQMQASCMNMNMNGPMNTMAIAAAAAAAAAAATANNGEVGGARDGGGV
jgi:hypothetical protein